jgi:hypothetical protein
MSERIEAVARTALDWGVRPAHLESRFVAALLTAMKGLGGIFPAAVTDLKAVLQSGKALADAEMARLRAANDAASIALSQARTAQMSLEVQRETLVTRDAWRARSWCRTLARRFVLCDHCCRNSIRAASPE